MVPSQAVTTCPWTNPAIDVLLHVCQVSHQQQCSLGHGHAGDGAGVLHIMDLPRNLRRRVPSEVNTMQAFLQRQLARLDYIQACKPRRAQLLKVLRLTPLHCNAVSLLLIGLRSACQAEPAS